MSSSCQKNFTTQKTVCTFACQNYVSLSYLNTVHLCLKGQGQSHTVSGSSETGIQLKANIKILVSKVLDTLRLKNTQKRVLYLYVVSSLSVLCSKFIYFFVVCF